MAVHADSSTVQTAAGAPANRYPELLRSTLSALLELTREMVEPTEDDFRATYARAAAAARAELEESVRRIEERHQGLRASTRHELEQRSRKIAEQFETESSTVANNMRLAREHVESQFDTTQREVTRARDQELVIAETIVQSTLRGLSSEFEQVQRQVTAARQQLRVLKDQTGHVLSSLRLPPAEEMAASPSPAGVDGDAVTAFQTALAAAEQGLRHLAAARLPRLFLGVRPYVLLALLALAAAGAVWGLAAAGVARAQPWQLSVPTAAAVVLTVAGLAGRSLKRRSDHRVREEARRLAQACTAAKSALDQRLRQAGERLRRGEADAAAKRDADVRAARQNCEAAMGSAQARRDAALQKIEDTSRRLDAEVHHRKHGGEREISAALADAAPAAQQSYDQEMAEAQRRCAERLAECQAHYDAACSSLDRRWRQVVEQLEALQAHQRRLEGRPFFEWPAAGWSQWAPPDSFPEVIPFGHWRVELGRLAGSMRSMAGFDETLDVLDFPAVLRLPDRGAILLSTRGPGREEALAAMRAIMVRLLTSLPPGQVRFTIIDPIGLGENFAGFMHLADHEEALIGGRIWTERPHIEQRLADLTAHMEDVIQKYLRNEFESIEAYNRQAGPLAEPYHFLVVANFPANFSEESARRLAAIAGTGPRCGVYTLISHDQRLKLPPGVHTEDLEASSLHLVYDGRGFVCQDDVLRNFPLALDAPPGDDDLTRIMHTVGQAAHRAMRVEVPFTKIAAAAEQYWSGACDTELRVPIGMSGATHRQHLGLGEGVSQHVLIAGKTGSGKSTLLHVAVTNLALSYSPDEVEFYLVDFKKGVEFKTYAAHALPHARVIAIESDREFGISVLQRLDAELQRRGEMFRQRGVQDIAAYRRITRGPLPRVLLVVDEFQVLFAEDDRLSQDAGVLLDHLVRQGRAFGIHVILGSQTLGGTSRLPRSTMGQMAVRIALQCSEADSLLILDDNNSAARLLSRPGEAIYNDAGGLVEGNHPFQVAWLPDAERDRFLERVCGLAQQRGLRREPPIVFEGNAPADIRQNRLLAECISAGWAPAAAPAAPQCWLGEAVAIKDPTSLTLRRQSGANVITVGQRDDAAAAIMSAVLIGLAAHHAPDTARFIILDGGPADSAQAGDVRRVAAGLPHAVNMVGWHDVPAVLSGLASELHERLDGAAAGPNRGADRAEPDPAGVRREWGPHAVKEQAIYLLVHGLQRFRMLRRREDDFGFAPRDADKPAAPDRCFAELLRDGPPVGIHTVVWSDTLATLERTLDRASIGEFDHRVLLQMSAADSSSLIDSPIANRLGSYRALLYSEEQGLIEKFRPYAAPPQDWLDALAARWRQPA